MRPERRLLALLLAVLLLTAGIAAYAEDGMAETPVYVDGLLSSRGRLLNGEAFVSVDFLCGYLELPVEYSGDDESVSISLPGVTVSGNRRDQYLSADGRYIFCCDGWIFDAGKLYLPAETAECIFGVTAETAEDGSMRIDTEGWDVIRGGEDYYRLNYQYDDLFWLTQIIHAEAGNEPFEGQVAVGNVVLNRVASPDFPPDVMSVIFEINGAVQFEPVINGSVLGSASEQSYIAACLSLDGARPVGDSLYFVSTDTNVTWFRDSLEFVRNIGGHNFYR